MLPERLDSTAARQVLAHPAGKARGGEASTAAWDKGPQRQPQTKGTKGEPSEGSGVICTGYTMRPQRRLASSRAKPGLPWVALHVVTAAEPNRGFPGWLCNPLTS